jgi:predicted hotdog family 3-hydroxylacyl-ACP dehydratase
MLEQSLEGENLYALLPHAGKMRLIDKVTQWDEKQIKCHTLTHLNQTNPLRENGQLCAVHAAEYGAQAMALHGGLLAQQAGQNQPGGYLVSLRGVKLLVQRLDTLDGPLVIQATQLLADAGNMLYDFALRTEHCLIAEGRAAVIVHAEENQ